MRRRRSPGSNRARGSGALPALRPQRRDAALDRGQFQLLALRVVGEARERDAGRVRGRGDGGSRALRLGLQIVEFEQQPDGFVFARLQIALGRGDLVLRGLVLARVAHGHQLLPVLRQPLLQRGHVAVAGPALRLPFVDGPRQRLQFRLGLRDRRLDLPPPLVGGVEVGTQRCRLTFEVLQVPQLLQARVHRGTLPLSGIGYRVSGPGFRVRGAGFGPRAGRGARRGVRPHRRCGRRGAAPGWHGRQWVRAERRGFP